MKTEELIKELKLSIQEGITVLDPLAKELIREYKMQQLVYSVLYGILTIILGIVIYKFVKRYNRKVEEYGYWNAEAIEVFAYVFVSFGILSSIIFTIISIVSYVSPVLSLMQSLTN